MRDDDFVMAEFKSRHAIRWVDNRSVSAIYGDDGRTLLVISGKPVDASIFLTPAGVDAVIEVLQQVQPRADYVTDANVPTPLAGVY